MFTRTKLITKFLNKNKQFINNLLGLSSINGINILFPIIITPLLVQKLGLENFGKLTFVQTIGIYIKTIIDFGFEPILIFRNANNKKKKINNDFSTILFLRFIFFFISIFVLLILLYGKIENHLLIAIIILSFAHIFNINWVFIIKTQTKLVAIITLFTKFLHLILILFLIKGPNDYILANYLVTFIGLLSTLIIILLAIYRDYIRLTTPQLISYIFYVKHSSWLFVPILIATVYSSLSVLTLGLFYTEKELGIYSISEKVVLAFISIINVFNVANFPILSKNFKQNIFSFLYLFKRFEKLLLLIGIIACIFVYLSSEFIISILVNESHDEAILKIRVLCFAIIFAPFGTFYNQIFILLNKKYIIGILTTIYFFVSLISIIIISKYFGFHYFGYNYLFSQIAVFLIGFFVLRHFLNKFYIN